MSTKRKRADVWNQFIENGKFGKFIYCKTQISKAGGSHSDLLRHLKAKHPTVTLNRQAPTAQTLSSPSQASSLTEGASDSGQLMSTAGQQIITNYIDRPLSNWKISECDRAVLKMVAKGNHALRIVEEKPFRELIDLVGRCPGYKLPTRTSLTNSLMPSVYEELKAKVLVELRAAYFVCVTTDAWTSCCNQKYIAVTAHFVDAEKM